MKRTLAIVSTFGLIFLSLGCSAEVKDALTAGWMDFLSTSVQDTLTALLPVSSLLGQ
jgi:hypothetical protein